MTRTFTKISTHHPSTSLARCPSDVVSLVRPTSLATSSSWSSFSSWSWVYGDVARGQGDERPRQLDQPHHAPAAHNSDTSVTNAGATVTVKTAGSFTISPTAPTGGNYVATTETPTNLTIKGAIRIVFAVAHVGEIHSHPLFPRPVVTEEDVAGLTVVVDSTTHVTPSLACGSGTFSCIFNPVALVYGVATFAGCTMSSAGTDPFHAVDGALTKNSASFTLT